MNVQRTFNLLTTPQGRIQWDHDGAFESLYYESLHSEYLSFTFIWQDDPYQEFLIRKRTRMATR